MKSKKVFLAIPAIFIVLLVGPFLLPTASYLARIEHFASQKLGTPVRIEKLRFALFPTPRVHLEGLAIGPDQDVRAAGIAAVFDVTTLFDEVRVISRLDVQEPVVRQSALALLGALAPQGERAGPAAVAVQRIVLEQARFEWPQVDLPPMDADIALGAGNALERIVLTSSAGNFKADVTPRDAGYAATVEATQWTLPAGPRLVFERLSADLHYSGTTLLFPRIEAALYRGSLAGAGRLDWTRRWQLSGQFKTHNIELGEATALFTHGTRVTGRISGDGRYSSVAREAAGLGAALALDYRFKVEDGVLYGVDLVKAASLLVRQGATGGETHFDELNGTLYTRGKQIELRPLHIVSGMLNADGRVKIAQDRKLSGQIDTDIKKGVSLVMVPLAVSGTLDSPVVLPTKAALAGAAAGTVLMGPLGTNLGTRAGSALQSLFGGDE